MMFERFTTAARNVVTGALAEASALHHNRIGTEHLLLGLLDPASGTAAAVLRDAQVERDHVLVEIERLVGRGRDPLGDADAQALRAIGIDLDSVRAAIEESFGPGALQSFEPSAPKSRWRRRRRMECATGALPFAPRSKKVLELSLREAQWLHHNYIGSEHILLGLLREGHGVAAQILVDAGLSLDDLRRRTLRMLEDAA
jgi:ATP-dependent Clp protease ATP-binding subunit ClpA